MSGGRRAAEPHSGQEAGKPARHARAETGADSDASAEAAAASEAHGTGAPAGERPAPAAGPARRRPRVGVVAVQGAFAEHVRRLRRLGCEAVELRRADDVAHPLDGVVLPGGESTTQSRLLRETGMLGPLRALIAAGLPTLGTCAGLILLAARVEGAGDLRGLDAAAAVGRAAVESLRTLDVTVSRNAYGRQLGSFHAEGTWEGGGAFPDDPSAADAATDDRVASAAPVPVPLTFIRAPRIERLGPGAWPLVTLDGQVVAVQQDAQIAAAFHPELDGDDRLYRRFLELMR